MSLPNPSGAAKPRVGIIGDGRAGSAIRRGLENSGYEVRIVGNNPEQVAETAKWGEVVVLAVPYVAVNDALKEMGDRVDGKVIVDLTNTLKGGEPVPANSTSGAEELQKKAPKSIVVKAFNTVFAACMDKGTAKGRQLTLFVAGDDKEAKTKVLDMGRSIGFEPVDAGPLSSARWLEPLGYLNILLGLRLGMGTEIGFSLVH